MTFLQWSGGKYKLWKWFNLNILSIYLVAPSGNNHRTIGGLGILDKPLYIYSVSHEKWYLNNGSIVLVSIFCRTPCTYQSSIVILLMYSNIFCDSFFRENNIRVFVMGDYEFLCSCYGITGANRKSIKLFTLLNQAY